MADHKHIWHTLQGQKDMLVCECDTMAQLKTVLANIATDTAELTKVQLLSKQIFNRELKKAARDEAYNWVMSRRKADGLPHEEQTRIV